MGIVHGNNLDVHGRNGGAMEDPTRRLVACASILIHASPSRIWDALTNPELIRKYMFGATVVSEWKEGGPIVRKGGVGGPGARRPGHDPPPRPEAADTLHALQSPLRPSRCRGEPPYSDRPPREGRIGPARRPHAGQQRIRGGPRPFRRQLEDDAGPAQGPRRGLGPGCRRLGSLVVSTAFLILTADYQR